MTKMTRKLLLSILTVVLTVVALGTTTFAWFTLTNVAVVQPFEAEIISDSGIEIAIGVPTLGVENLGLNWVTTLTAAAVNDYIEATYGETAGESNFRFNHVTTSDGETFRTLGLGAPGATVTTGYLELPIHFRSNTAVAIDWTNVTLGSTNFPWTVDTAFNAIGYGTDYEALAVTSGDILSLNAADAFRIAVIGDITGTASNIVTYERPATTTAPINHILGAVDNVTPLTSYAGVETAVPGTYEGTFGAHSYYFNDARTSPFGIESFYVLSTIQSISDVRVLDMTDIELNAGATNYGSIKILVWLEGWDLNAYNAILSQTISTSFEFTGASA